MASGNLGDLFVSLGIKDEMSATLRKIVNGMKGIDQATLDAKKRGEDLIKSLNGINGNNFSKVFRDATKYIEDNSKGLSNIISLLKKVEDKADSNAIASKFFGAKDLPRIAEYLTAINAEFAKMAKDEARADSIKAWQSRISNSLEYIKVLQDIDLWQNKIDSTRSRNPNVNSKELDAAEKSLANIRSQIVGLLSSGGIDTSGVLGSINKLLSIAKRDVSGIISKFKEENPLSVFSGGTAKVEADIARVTEKLAKMRDLMSEGTAKGYNTSMLGGNITELNNLLQRLQSALSNKSMLTDAGQMKNLLSDVALGMTKASAATQAYGREKGKVIAQEREHNRYVAESNKSVNDASIAYSRLSSIIKGLNNWHGRGLNVLGVDATKDIRQSLSVLSQYQSILEQIRNNGGRHPITGQTAKDIIGSADYKIAIDNAKEYAREVKQSIKEVEKAMDDARKRYVRLFDSLNSLRNTRAQANIAGVDTSKIDSQITSTLSALRELRTIMQTGIGDAKGVVGSDSRSITLASRVNKEVQEGIRLERQRQQEIVKSAAKARNDLAAAFAGANAEAKKMQSIVGDIKSLFLQGGIVFGAQQFFNSIVQTGGEIVQQHVALRSILGDVAKADELFAQTQQLALQSPFKFGELNRDVKQLAAFGVEANDLYDTTKRLADISSGLGVSFERLGLAYGQVKARSWLDGKELRQFAYAGLPLLQRITEMYNATGKNGRSDYTQADVKKMISNRGVSFEDVQKVLWDMTNEGGQFYNMQFVLSETLLGKWNKLIDAWEIMLGKFAEGRSVIGRTFNYAISGVTDLVLALDKLSPLLLSLGGTYVAKKGIGALYNKVSSKSGIGGMLSSQKEAVDARLREYAIQQQQLVIEKQITQEKATQKVAAMGYALTSKEEQVNATQRLALEGRLSIMQMQKAYREGLITPELLSQLEVMGMISTKQKEIIANATIENRVRAAGMTMMNGVGKLFTWSNAAFVGISVAIGAVMQYFQKAEEVEQRSKDIATSAQQRINSLEEALSATKNITKDTDSSEVEKVNEQLQEVLEQSGLFTETIKEQISQASTLTEKYQILKGAVSDAKEASSVQGKFSDTISKAIDSSGGFLNEDITENIKDVMESYNKMQTLLAGLDDATKERMSSIANQFLKPEQASLSLEEKIDLLADMSEGDFDRFVRAASNGSNDIAHSLYLIRDRANITKNHFDEIAKDDVPKILEVIRVALGKNEKEFRSWAQHNVKSFDSMFMKIIELCNANVPTIITKLRKIFYESVGLEPPKEPSKSGNKPKPYNSGLKAGGAGENARKKLQKSGKLNKSNYKSYDAELLIYDSESSEEFGENLRKQYKEIRNENNARKKAGRKVSAESLARQKRIEEIASVSGVSLDVGKDRVTGDFGKGGKNDHHEDTALKNWQERLSAYKSARQTYQNYKKLPGWDEEKAKKYVESLYTNIAGLDLSNYEAAMDTLQKSMTFNTPERKKALTQLIRERADWRYSEVLKPESEDKANDNNEEMEALVKRLDLQKELVEKTGDKNFGDMAWGYNIMVDDKVETMMNQYYAKYGKLFGASDALTTTESQAKKKYTGEGEFDAWKQITTLLKDNYYNALKKSADVIKEHLSDEEKIASTRAKYNELIKDAEKVGNKRAVTAYRHDLRKEVAKLNLGKYKKTEEYMNFFGSIVSLGKTEAKKYAKNIENELNKAMRDGAISAKEYSDEVAKLGEQLKKLDEVQPSFLHGGLGGIAQGMRSQGEEKVQAGNAKYTKAKEMYDLFQELGDGHGMTTEQMKMNTGESMMQGGQQLMNGADEMEGAIAMIDAIIHGINDLVQGLNDTFQDIKETAEALGGNTNTDGWTDADSFFSGFASASASATKGWDSLKNGDIGGVISGVVGSFTGWIKSFSAGHDKKLDRQIELAERELKELQNLSSNIKQSVEDSLGGIYNYQRSTETMNKLGSIKQDYEVRQRAKNDPNPFKRKKYADDIYTSDTYNAVNDAMGSPSYYHDQLALLKAQKDEVQRQQKAEEGKKKSDDSKIQDYKQQVTELDQSINTFAQNFLKEVYSIDLKSWASELTDAVVSAWENGEDAVDAYRKKVKDMVKDVTKNIVSQKIMQMALEKPLSFLENTLKEKGQLDETDMATFARSLIEAGDTSVSQITQAFESLKQMGYDMSDNGNSSSTTNSVKGITEETADILASYVNAIRLDVSVNRENVKQIADAMKSLPEMGAIARSQLTAMNQLVTLAEYRNSKLDDMYAWMRSVTSGSGARSIKVN